VTIDSDLDEDDNDVVVVHDTAMEANNGCEAAKSMFSKQPGATQPGMNTDGTDNWVFRGLVQGGALSREFLVKTLEKTRRP